MTSKPERVFLVDLDGTLLAGNSFHLWLAFMLGKGGQSIGFWSHLLSRMRLCWVAGLRALMLIDHAALKKAVQKEWGLVFEESQKDNLTAFLDILVSRLDATVMAEVKGGQAKGSVAVLTTAAAAEYAVPLGAALGFDESVATPAFGDGGWCHNIGDKKKERTLDALRRRGWDELEKILFTDHVDDVPLMDVVQEVCIVTERWEQADRLLSLVPDGVRKRVHLRRERNAHDGR